jgi:HAD superfamily hydrolase (TIGR01509 family)
VDVFATIAVDLGGVAARYTPARRLDALVAATGFRADEITERVFGSGLETRLERGEIGIHDHGVQALLDALERRLDASALVEAWSRAFTPDAEVLSILAQQTERVVLFTNNGPIVELCLDGPLRRIQKACDDVVSSWRLRAVKPEPAAFERFARVIGGPADALLLLDDSAPNVEAARTAGWAADQVANAAELLAALNKHRP